MEASDYAKVNGPSTSIYLSSHDSRVLHRRPNNLRFIQRWAGRKETVGTPTNDRGVSKQFHG